MAFCGRSVPRIVISTIHLRVINSIGFWSRARHCQRLQQRPITSRSQLNNLNQASVTCVPDRAISQNFEMSSNTGKTAAIIIIGDEVLKGQVSDINSHYLAKELFSLGIKLCRISTIPDELDTIASEVYGFSESYDYVFTTGGIGPTHDDVTYIGVAQAFNETAEVNNDMFQILETWLGGKGYEAELIKKMARMPSCAQLLFDQNKLNSFPIVNVRNVYIFPGIPQYVRRMFPRLRLVLQVSQFYTKVLFIDCVEMGITPQLNMTVDKFKAQVTFGSYPVLDNLYYSTKITMQSSVKEDVEAAQEFFSNLLPAGRLVDYDEDPVSNAATKVYAMVNNESHPLHGPVSVAVKKLEEALDRFGLDGVCICFNGGKDCTALLHLLHAVVQKRRESEDQVPPKLQTLSIKYANPFPEMEEFIQLATAQYSLNMWTYDGPIHSGLSAAIKEHPETKAVLMGTRRSDPSGKALDYFQMTDPTWPTVMRVSPMLDWTYTEVWSFLRSLTLPYCAMYNRGYTSIGSQSNTTPNEALKTVNSAGEVFYKPAYALDDATSERNGRQ